MRLSRARSTDSKTTSRATRLFLARLPFHNVLINTPQHEGQTQRSITLTFQRPTGAKSYTINLTGMTEVELQLFREALLIGVEIALPIVRERDKLAKEALDDGDPDADDRVYRGLPIVVVNKGILTEHDQRILDGHKDVLAGSTQHVITARPTGDSGGDLDEHQQEEG